MENRAEGDIAEVAEKLLRGDLGAEALYL